MNWGWGSAVERCQPFFAKVEMTKLSAVWLIILFTAQPLMAAVSPPPSSYSSMIEVRPYQGTNICTYDRIMAGPGGDGFVAWAGEGSYILGPRWQLPPSMIVVGRIGDHGASQSSTFAYFGGGKRLFPIRWSSADNRLYIRVREPNAGVIAVRADGSPATDVYPLESTWNRFDLTSTSHGDVEPLRNPQLIARARQVDGRELLYGSATLGSDLEMVAVKRSDLQLVRLGDSTRTPTNINASETRALSVLPDSGRLEAGIVYRGAPMEGVGPYLPYQVPLFDLATGRIVGRFGATRIEVSGPATLSKGIEEFNRLQQANGRMILDASLSEDLVIVLTMSARGDRRIVSIKPDGVRDRPLCTSPEVESRVSRRAPPYPVERPEDSFQPRVRAFAIDADGRETAAPGRPILLLHQLGEQRSDEAVLYFHGGPGSTLADGYRSAAIDQLLEPGRDLIQVEYSGSLGGGTALTRRLGRLGMSALEEDIDAIVGWLESNDYERIYVAGTSFGAIPTLVAVTRHRALFPAAFFIAPALRLKHPTEWAAWGSGRGSVAVDTQLAYEQALLGGARGRARFVAELDALAARAPLSSADRFYFAERDPMSQPTDLPPGTLSPYRVHRTARHFAIEATMEIWRDIESQMQ